jgi:hypothetical protein
VMELDDNSSCICLAYIRKSQITHRGVIAHASAACYSHRAGVIRCMELSRKAEYAASCVQAVSMTASRIMGAACDVAVLRNSLQRWSEVHAAPSADPQDKRVIVDSVNQHWLRPPRRRMWCCWRERRGQHKTPVVNSSSAHPM